MLTRARLKAIKGLARRRGREEEQAFLAEGVRVLEEALRHGVLPEELLVATGDRSERAAQLVAGFRERGVSVLEVAPEDLGRMADAETPQGVLGVFALPDLGLVRMFRASQRMRLAVLDGIGDPGNLGTLLRSALAFGFGSVAVLGESADPWAPKVVRSSAGALFGLEIVRDEDPDLLLELIERFEVPLVAASAQAGGDEVDGLFAGDCVALAIGSEARGLSAAVAAAANATVRIAHSDAVESLNAAVAGSILLQRAWAARR